jgi:nijmegen breakage syndrome protein 1
MVGDETAAEQFPESSVSAPAPPSRRMGRTRRTVTSRFKGFDDDFDTPILPESNPATYTQPAISQSKDQGLFVSQADSMDIDLQSSQAAATQTRSSRKRPSPPPIAEEDEEDVLDQIAPAAANLKRRRLADEAARRRRGESTPPPPIVPPKKTEETKLKRKKVKPEIDVLEVARERREKEEAIAKAEREALQEAMEGMDIEQIRNLAVIEEMEVKRTVPPPRASAQGDEANDRWDERWNGRKNFKNFRRRGELVSRLISKVIVPLEEVKKKDFGIGDEYWLEGDRDSQRKKKGKSRARESQAVDNTQSQTQAPRRQTPQTVVIDEVEVVDTSPRSQRASTRSQKSTTTTIMPSSQSTQNKRAAEPLTKPAPAKKARQATKTMKTQDSDDSDDGLGFRFRKKK